MSTRVASRDAVHTAQPSTSMATPETLEALEECRARIELLSHVNESTLRNLSKKQLVGVVGDLLAMAARQEFERERRFEKATSSASVRRANEKAERERALQRERARVEDAKRLELQKKRNEAAITIQKRVRGNKARSKAHHRAEALRNYEKDLEEAELRAKETLKREQGAVTIQSVFRARVARREARSLWLQAWSKNRKETKKSGMDFGSDDTNSRNYPASPGVDTMSIKSIDSRAGGKNQNSETVYSPLSALKNRRRERRNGGYVFFAQSGDDGEHSSDQMTPQNKQPSNRPPTRTRNEQTFRLHSDSE